MGFFSKLFGTKHTKLELVDSELGKFDSDYIKGSDVMWLGSVVLFGKSIELIMDGNREELSQIHKNIILSALGDQENLKAESTVAIKQEYDNADLKFISINEQLTPVAISTNNEGFQLSFEQNEKPYFYFNVFFENNKQVGVSIDS